MKIHYYTLLQRSNAYYRGKHFLVMNASTCLSKTPAYLTKPCVCAAPNRVLMVAPYLLTICKPWKHPLQELTNVNGAGRPKSLFQTAWGGVKAIPFTTKVPKGIPFYSAHFKIDALRWFASLPYDEYSVLLDNDVVCVAPLPNRFFETVRTGKPLNYTLRHYTDEAKRTQMHDICVDVDISSATWSGGEVIGGTAGFYGRFVEKIDNILPHYFEMLAKENLFHIGDEMPVSIAWHLLQREGMIPDDAYETGLLYRYWGNEEIKSPLFYGTSLLHIPYDKVFLAGLSIDRLKSPDDIIRLYRYRRLRNTIVRYVKRIIGRK